MTKRQFNNKKDLAKSLFVSGEYTQEEISELTGVCRRTITNWVKKENWNEIKRATTITPDKIISHLNKQLDDISANIESREKGKRFATTAEADAILKLSATIKNLRKEIGLSDIVSVAMNFITWLRRTGESESAKTFTNLFDAYIKEIAETK